MILEFETISNMLHLHIKEKTEFISNYLINLYKHVNMIENKVLIFIGGEMEKSQIYVYARLHMKIIITIIMGKYQDYILQVGIWKKLFLKF